MFFALFLAFMAHAQDYDCKEIRLDQGKGSLAQVPVYDQNTKNVCYAIVAAEMTDAYRFSHGDTNTKHLTSPLATAAYFSGDYRARLNEIGPKQKDVEEGIVPVAIYALRKYGSCNENAVFKKDINMYRRISKLNALLDKYRKKKNAPEADRAQLVCEELQDTGISLTSVFLEELVSKVFSDQEYYTYLRDLFLGACKDITIPLRKLPNPVVQSEMQKMKREEKQKILEQFLSKSLGQENPQPLALDFCSELLHDRHYGEYRLGFSSSFSCSEHSSLIVGQRRGESGCEVLIRDSGGTDCPYQSWPCEGGQYWLPVHLLAKYTQQLSYLTP